MDRMTYQNFKGFKNYLAALESSKKLLVIYGENHVSKEYFTKTVAIERCKKKLLSCTNLDIRHIDFYIKALHSIRFYLQDELNIKVTSSFYMDDSQFIKRYVSKDLYLIHLMRGPIHYYILSSIDDINQFRQFKFNDNDKTETNFS